MAQFSGFEGDAEHSVLHADMQRKTTLGSQTDIKVVRAEVQ